MSLPTTNLSRPHRFYIAKRYFKGHSGAQLHLCETENEFRVMTEENQREKRYTLRGDAVLELWQKGMEAWNSWMEQFPNTTVIFDFVDFSNYRKKNQKLSFEGYHFGDASFLLSCFGDGGVDFSGARFHGDVDFSKAYFGDGNVDFYEARFCGHVNFCKACFANGDVDFSKTHFTGKFLNFEAARFDNGHLDFTNAIFENCNVVFIEANLTKLTFHPKSFGLGSISAQALSVERHTLFIIPFSDDSSITLTMYGASFGGALFVSGNFGIVPDLRATRCYHQVDLSGLKVKLPRTFGWPPKLSRVAEDPEDGARLRRLKEIAETNKDHQAALRFSADENRAKRWIETSWFGSVLDMAFSFFSDYGQSILRPVLWLLAIFVDGTSIYLALATGTLANWRAGLEQAALLSASNSLPFLPQSRDLREDALTALYGTDPSLCIDILMIAQGVLSFIFLFLIGLGLRNRFRL
ncbi:MULTISPECIES: pentapeptide repeat-containing protein [Thalassospira]|uniref:pentapeptide repeat-containing protein n=1 Tax=Thalassospira TaxID=168934 RepID=UPI0008DD2BA3|nr:MULTISPECIES: pentapeptide repeat-containing protein [Thalassospira]MDM7978550.1 pentapeptide repeat-containing protein [Thalassospira xiamenensis]